MHGIWKRRGAVFLCILALIAGISAPTASAVTIAVPDSWAAEEVEAAVRLGLVPEDMQKNYGADITRAEFCRLAVICLT